MNKKQLWLKTALSLLVSAVAFPGSLPAHAGFDGTNCTWGGEWNSYWSYADGSKAASKLLITPNSNGIKGIYETGAFEGTVVKGKPWLVRGKWWQTQGSQASGNFLFKMTIDRSGKACNLTGQWSSGNSTPNLSWDAIQKW
ncbi:hypothetical protein NIES4101_82420 [Calothrix sp. NIES-4101]|nr:hypothetical protein NIES4101_82420 [Calothrix sp. NIES-4101]